MNDREARNADLMVVLNALFAERTSPPPLTDQELAGFLASGEFLEAKRFPCGRVAAVREFMFTYAIIADLNSEGYTRRWCYSDKMATLCALEDWTDYDGAPEGWHREVHTGMRRDKDGQLELNP